MAIETLGDAERAGWRVRISCARGKRDGLKTIRECAFSYDPDLMSLMITRGRDFEIARLVERVECPRCKSRRMRVIYLPPEGRGQVAQAAAR